MKIVDNKVCGLNSMIIPKEHIAVEFIFKHFYIGAAGKLSYNYLPG